MRLEHVLDVKAITAIATRVRGCGPRVLGPPSAQARKR
jgi:hypothetical protein